VKFLRKRVKPFLFSCPECQSPFLYAPVQLTRRWYRMPKVEAIGRFLICAECHERVEYIEFINFQKRELTPEQQHQAHRGEGFHHRATVPFRR